MGEKKPLVSVILTTKNEAGNINQCLESIKNQKYTNIEIIVVDNKSTDATVVIAKKFTKYIFTKGPERSAQRNFGAKKAKGKYVLFLDADMILGEEVVWECVTAIEKERISSVTIPEESIGVGFWAQCKRLERSYMDNIDWLEAPRFFSKNIFSQMGGYDEENTGTEDYDLPQRIKEKYGVSTIGRIQACIRHNEGNLSLWKTMKKKYYYGKNVKIYKSRKSNKKYFNKQASLLNRYLLYLSNPKKLFNNPFIGMGMIFMKSMEFAAGGFGYIISAIQ